jgi:DNA polymerase kappa
VVRADLPIVAYESKAYLGIADNAVAPGKRGERKSVGVERQVSCSTWSLTDRTFRDKTQDEDILATLVEIAEELGKDLEKLQYAGKTVTVKYKVGRSPRQR